MTVAATLTDRDPKPIEGARSEILPEFWRQLLHRWLIEYNPLYLLSAALVLGGTLVLSSPLSSHDSDWAGLGMKAIPEIYAWTLIGGAALLTRIGLRRPATMLALLTILHLGDPMLTTETYAYPGGVGAFAVTSWLALFVLKLRALAWAAKLELSWSAFAVAVWGAVGLAAMPRLLCSAPDLLANHYVIGWLFSLFALALWTHRRVESRVDLDDWGKTVLRRSLRASWLVWAVLLSMHLAFWSREFGFELPGVLPCALLLATRWMRRELSVWGAVASTLYLTAHVAMPLFPVVALLAAATLALRALRQPVTLRREVEPSRRSVPYRAAGGDGRPAAPAETVWQFGCASASARRRLLLGSICSSYLAVWTWRAGMTWDAAWPAHYLALDIAFSATLLLLVLVSRLRLAWLPFVVTWLDCAVAVGLIGAPQTATQWGVSAVVLGFALLVLSVLGSWWWQRRVEFAREPPGS